MLGRSGVELCQRNTVKTRQRLDAAGVSAEIVLTANDPKD